ncbi:MAG: hypothetical protein FWE33_02275 [Defluviitaleaceae bacterium]|nr:hypothetical protein [Defluviitaleaceae bacterium]
MNYFRQFFTLATESTLGRRNATGRVVLEARGDSAKATVFLQDANEGAYRLLAFAQNGAAADIGAIIIGKNGGFDGKFELERNNIAGFGLQIEAIDGVAITTPKDGANFDVVLTGFKSEAFVWRNNLRFGIEKDVAEVVEVSEAITEISEITIEETEEIIDEVIEEIKEIIEGIVEELPETIIEIAAEEVPPPVYAETVFEHIHPAPEIIEEIVEEIAEEAIQEDIAEIFLTTETAENTENNAQYERINNFFAGRNAVDVFKNQEPAAEWVAASLVDLQNLGLYTNEISQNDFITNKARQYRHVLLGRTAENPLNKYILGVPDIFTQDQTVMAQGVFDMFKYCNPEAANQSGHGYWIKELTI